MRDKKGCFNCKHNSINTGNCKIGIVSEKLKQDCQYWEDERVS